MAALNRDYRKEMIPKILHQSSKYYTWEERRIATKAQALMPEWKYHCWTDQDNWRLVEQIYPGYVNEFTGFSNGAIRSDVARYLYMYQYGGIYFDTDFRFFVPIKEDLLLHRCILGVEDEHMPELGGGPKLGNAFIGSEPGFAMWAELVESIFARFRKGETSYPWKLSGPYALTAFLKSHNRYAEIVTILPRNVLYPKLTNFNLTGLRDRDTIGVHLCWSSWREMSLPHMVKNRARRILSAALA